MLRFVVPALVLAEGLDVDDDAVVVRCWIVALISQCSCMRMLLIAAFVCSISSLLRWLSFMIIMLVRPSTSVKVVEIRDTSSRRFSCSVRRW